MEAGKHKPETITVNDPETISVITANLTKEFITHGLAKEVKDRLWLLPLASIYGDRGKPYIGSSLQNIKDCFINEIALFPEQRKVHADSLNTTLAEFDAFERTSYESLFKGLDKRLPVPILIARLEDLHQSQRRLKANTTTTAHPTAFLLDEAKTSFNPKNLQRHYGFPESDSKKFFSNFKNYYGDNQVFLVKKSHIKSLYTRNIFILNLGDEPLAMWSYSQDQSVRRKVEHETAHYLEELLSITTHELPIPDLQTWKNITEGWFTRVKGGNWNDLDVRAQQRHIVNVIRHNSVAYDRSWRHVEPELVKQFHDAAFDRTLRQILNEFPWLAEECKRQMNERGI
ncbi:hypothetical protein [Vibrio sp. D431a]|uniref:hypothetical protein n=1 Tax=Vibrio sp. D431a TaxID=2837388 RepID=UPI002556C03E|nr:hypothetical protein [Vibrio sp. D431a]MDK9790113.1 hypothetical protein [Vibrio sp. D431a]